MNPVFETQEERLEDLARNADLRVEIIADCQFCGEPTFVEPEDGDLAGQGDPLWLGKALWEEGWRYISMDADEFEAAEGWACMECVKHRGATRLDRLKGEKG